MGLELQRRSIDSLLRQGCTHVLQTLLLLLAARYLRRAPGRSLAETQYSPLSNTDATLCALVVFSVGDRGSRKEQTIQRQSSTTVQQLDCRNYRRVGRRDAQPNGILCVTKLTPSLLSVSLLGPHARLLPALRGVMKHSNIETHLQPDSQIAADFIFVRDQGCSIYIQRWTNRQ